MNNNITNLKRIPFVPKMSREFKPMKHYLCETDTSAKLISRIILFLTIHAWATLTRLAGIAP